MTSARTFFHKSTCPEPGVATWAYLFGSCQSSHHGRAGSHTFPGRAPSHGSRNPELPSSATCPHLAALPGVDGAPPAQGLVPTTVHQSVGQLHARTLMSAWGLNPGATISTGQLWSECPHPPSGSNQSPCPQGYGENQGQPFPVDTAAPPRSSVLGPCSPAPCLDSQPGDTDSI